MQKKLIAARLKYTEKKREAKISAIYTLNIDTNKAEKFGTFKEFIESLETLTVVYFNDIKSIGDFIICGLKDLGYEYEHIGIQDKPANGHYFAMINGDAIWYSVRIKTFSGKFVELRDLQKLCPITLYEMRKAFSESEADELAVIRDTIKALYIEGINGLTIGTSARKLLKMYIDDKKWERNFPALNSSIYDFCERAYTSGWIYCRKRGERAHGYVIDKNSLYPYVMNSNRKFPVGYPADMSKAYFEELTYLPDDRKYFFVRFSVKTFKLKEGFLPFIERKGDMKYATLGCLSTSEYESIRGKRQPAEPLEFTMTETEYKLFIKYYDFTGFKYIKGMWFRAVSGKYLFGDFVNYWYNIKKNSEGGKRQISKLVLNNISGKFSASKKSDYRIPVVRDGVAEYDTVKENNGTTLYLPIGCAIVSYGREETIEAAQQNVDIFNYADTDSLHVECDSLDDIKGVHIDNKELGAWKVETEFSSAKYLREKAYVDKDINGGYIIKCAGMPDACKAECEERLNEIGFDAFDFGQSFDGREVLKHVKGGCVIKTEPFTLCRGPLDRI